MILQYNNFTMYYIKYITYRLNICNKYKYDYYNYKTTFVQKYLDFFRRWLTST